MEPLQTRAPCAVATTRIHPIVGVAVALGPPSLGWSGSSDSGIGAAKGRRDEGSLG